MPYAWPKDTDFTPWELDVLNRACAVCGRGMYICDHRYRHFHTLEGPVELVCKLNHCPDPACPGHAHTKSPELEVTLAGRPTTLRFVETHFLDLRVVLAEALELQEAH